MKNMRKALAVLFALTLAAGMTACGETGGTAADSSSAAETSAAETSAAESSEDSAEESAAAETSAAESREEAASNGDYVMETHSTEHAPLGIKLDLITIFRSLPITTSPPTQRIRIISAQPLRIPIFTEKRINPPTALMSTSRPVFGARIM